MVIVDEDGNYVYLGRQDGMVKTRGYRVELGEVEAALYGHPAIREAMVLPIPDELLGSRLRAGHGAAHRWSSARRCPGPPPARSTAPGSPGTAGNEDEKTAAYAGGH